MKKVYKCALINEQIEGMLNLIKDNDNLVEIHLLGLDDDLSLLRKFEGKICSIHLPVQGRYCDLSKIMETCETKNEYFDFLNSLIRIVPEIELVAHANICLEYLLNLDKYTTFLKWVDNNNVHFLLENTTSINDGKRSIVEPIQISSRFNKILKKDLFSPLLDICHYQIARTRIDSILKYNLTDVFSMYAKEGMKIHLCSAIGSGHEVTGGVHGSNFKEDVELLKGIINEIYKYDPYLILEVIEDDYYNRPNAVWLNNKIDEIIGKLPQNQYIQAQ